MKERGMEISENSEGGEEPHRVGGGGIPAGQNTRREMLRFYGSTRGEWGNEKKIEASKTERSKGKNREKSTWGKGQVEPWQASQSAFGRGNKVIVSQSILGGKATSGIINMESEALNYNDGRGGGFGGVKIRGSGGKRIFVRKGRGLEI